MTKKEEKQLSIYQRIHAVMQDVSYVQKEDRKVNNQYTFVSHDAVTAKIRAAMVKHGVIAIWNIDSHTITPHKAVKYDNYKKANVEYTVYVAECCVSVKFVNVDNKENFIESRGWVGTGFDQGDKAIGKACSYAKKYCLLNNFMLETGDDPERDVEVHEIQEQKAAPDPNLIDVTKICDYLDNVASAEVYKQWSNDESKFIKYNADEKQMSQIMKSVYAAKERLGIDANN